MITIGIRYRHLIDTYYGYGWREGERSGKNGELLILISVPGRKKLIALLRPFIVLLALGIALSMMRFLVFVG